MKERKKEMSWSIDILSAWSVSLSFCHPIWLKFHDLDYSFQVVLVVERALNVPKLLNTLGLDIFAPVIFFKQKSSLNLKMGWHYQSVIFTICIFFQVQGNTLLHHDFHAVITTTFLLVIILFCWSQIVGCILHEFLFICTTKCSLLSSFFP